MINIVTADHMFKTKSNVIQLYFTSVKLYAFYISKTYEFSRSRKVERQSHCYHHSLLKLADNTLKGWGNRFLRTNTNDYN